MLRKNTIPIKNSFNIWFNREKRKEFYTSSVILYKTTFNHDYNNRFPSIMLESDENNKEIILLHLILENLLKKNMDLS